MIDGIIPSIKLLGFNNINYGDLKCIGRQLLIALKKTKIQ